MKKKTRIKQFIKVLNKNFFLALYYKMVGVTRRFKSLVGELFLGKDGLTVIAGAGVLMGAAAAAGATSTYVMVNKANKDTKVLNKTLLYAAAAGTGVLTLEGAVQAYDLIVPRLSCSGCSTGTCNVLCDGCC
jgi:ABC-type Co2+ transport system permease subunit